MTKKDLILIHDFIDSKNPIPELNFAHLKDDGIYAYDTKKAIKFHADMLGLDLLLEKRLLKGFIGTVGKDYEVSIDGFGNIRHVDNMMNCNTCTFEFEPVDFDSILNIEFQHHFVLESIDDLQFELAQRNCFIDEEQLNPIIAYAECNKFNIFYNEQVKEKTESGVSTNSGIVKIVGIYSTEDDPSVIKFTAVVMGRTFESKAMEE